MLLTPSRRRSENVLDGQRRDGLMLASLCAKCPVLGCSERVLAKWGQSIWKYQNIDTNSLRRAGQLTKKELWQICLVNGIPPLLYKWSFTQHLEDCWLKRKLTPIFDDIDKFIRGRKVWYVCTEDSVLGSRVGVTFFKVAILNDWYNVRYTTIENLAGYQMENWYENGDVYTSILNADLVVVDKIKHKMEDLQRKVWDKFVEDRLLLNKSTIFVGLVPPNRIFDERAIDLLKDVGAKIVSENKIQPICPGE